MDPLLVVSSRNGNEVSDKDASTSGTFRGTDGKLRNSDGTFATDSSKLDTDLHRPALRAGTKRQIESNSPTNAEGAFVDASGNVITNRHFGHITGHENRSAY